MRSARFSTALSSAPTTKPSWTLMVSHDCPAADSCHSAVSCGTTAEAENQRAIASIEASASHQRLRHLRLIRPEAITPPPTAWKDLGAEDHESSIRDPRPRE